MLCSLCYCAGIYSAPFSTAIMLLLRLRESCYIDVFESCFVLGQLKEMCSLVCQLELCVLWANNDDDDDAFTANWHCRQRLALYKYVYFFSSTSTKPQALDILLSKVWLQQRLIGVRGFEESDHISPLGAIDNCWNRSVDSLGSPVINVARLPISWTSSTAQWFQVPHVSMATG